MIYSLKGTLTVSEANFCVIECGGVGYGCFISLTTARKLHPIGKEVKIAGQHRARIFEHPLAHLVDLGQRLEDAPVAAGDVHVIKGELQPVDGDDLAGVGAVFGPGDLFIKLNDLARTDGVFGHDAVTVGTPLVEDGLGIAIFIAQLFGQLLQLVALAAAAGIDIQFLQTDDIGIQIL